MADDPTNGGKRINVLEMKGVVTETVIAELVKQVAHTNEILERYFGPDGFCPKHQKLVIRNLERIDNNRAWIKALWAFGIILIGIAVKAAFFK